MTEEDQKEAILFLNHRREKGLLAELNYGEECLTLRLILYYARPTPRMDKTPTTHGNFLPGSKLKVKHLLSAMNFNQT